ncbi:MAG: flagellar motor stator protein MotA [Deltaproteobacteria bacterium GWA2_55_10]|nr:MAG: flagellar motor stator protein MotA [Deltaproteobacteria bacterium GWA2_55_10]
MFPVIGIVIVFGSIIGGYLFEQGNLYILLQPAELIIIGGAAVGSLIITCPPKLLTKIFKEIPKLFSSGPAKHDFLDLLGLLYGLFSKIKKEGLLALEADVEHPAKSPIFKKHRGVLKNHHAVEFICDNFRVYILGIKPYDFEEMMDLEIETHHHESSLPSAVISKVADSLPGFGIVAAVLGVVITMGKMSESPEAIGHSIAAALVGTFLGILLCYGLLGPIASNLEHRAREEAKYFEAIKVAILAFAKDMPPQLAIEAARRVLMVDTKPSFKELEKTIKKKAA